METDVSSCPRDPDDLKAEVQMDRLESPGSSVSTLQISFNDFRKPVIYALVFFIIFPAIFAFVWMSYSTDIQPAKNQPKTNKIHTSPSTFRDSWISDEQILIKSLPNEIQLFDVKTNNVSTLMQTDKKYDHVDISADHQFLLLAILEKKIYRHSYTAYYEVFNIKNNSTDWLRSDKEAIQLVEWSPVSNGLAFVKQNDIYYVKSVANLTDAVRLTNSGSSIFYNGVPDWVYEEEVFGSKSAMWFSKNGSHLAYASFNESQVPTVELLIYDSSESYDAVTTIHYPKVGAPNPVVKLFVECLNSSTPNPITVNAPSELTNVSTDIILKSVFWSDDTNLFVIWMNRVQNESYLVRYVVTVGSVYTENMVFFRQPGGWLDFEQLPLVGNNHRLAIIFPVEQLDDGFFKHIVVVEPDGNRTTVTNGKFEVIKLLKWDVPSNYIYFLANTERNPEEQYMYRTIVKKQSVPECMSCNSCKYCKNVHMSTGNSYYVLDCLGPNVADIQVGLFKTTSVKMMDYKSNVDFKKELSSVSLQETTFMDVPVGDGYKARVKLIVPPSVDKNKNGKYPLLIFTYAGPGSNYASSLEFKHYTNDLTTLNGLLENVVVAIIDGRGSGRMGNRHLFANYKRLGTYDVEDQITVTKSILDQNPYLDKSKTAIWGWSYGGYVAGMVMAKDDGKVFKCGVSVAPVTDFKFYDSIYSERYMGLVEENDENYIDSSLLTHAKNIKDNTFMVIHGTFDDNVHVKHTMALSSVLSKTYYTKFRQHIFPDETHDLSNVSSDLFQMIKSFLSDCFQLDKS